MNPLVKSARSGLYPLVSHGLSESPDKVLAWTDGSCCKEKFGGWAYHVEHGERFIQGSGGAEATTISMMEMEAVRQVLLRLSVMPNPLEIRSDSQYVVRTFTDWIHGWKDCGWTTAAGTPVKNVEMVKEVWELLQQHRTRRPVALVWVRGHAGERGNEICDVLCGRARLDAKALKLISTARDARINLHEQHIPTATPIRRRKR